MTAHVPSTGGKITRYSKAIVALIGSVLTVLVGITPLLGDGTVSDVVAVILAVGTGISTYLVRNTPAIADLADQAESLGYSVVKR